MLVTIEIGSPDDPEHCPVTLSGGWRIVTLHVSSISVSLLVSAGLLFYSDLSGSLLTLKLAAVFSTSAEMGDTVRYAVFRRSSCDADE